MKKIWYAILAITGLYFSSYAQNDTIIYALPQKKNIIKVGYFFIGVIEQFSGASLGYEKFLKPNSTLDINYKWFALLDTEGDHTFRRHSIEIGLKHFVNLNSKPSNAIEKFILKNRYLGIYIKPVLTKVFNWVDAPHEAYYFSIGTQLLTGKMLNIGERFSLETGIGVSIEYFSSGIFLPLPQARLRIGLRY